VQELRCMFNLSYNRNHISKNLIELLKRVKRSDGVRVLVIRK